MKVLVVVSALTVGVVAAGLVVATHAEMPDPLADPLASDVVVDQVAVPQGVPATILAAGDIASCNGGASATGRLLAANAGVVAALGDLAYQSGTSREFARCYAPTWGAFLDRTRPAIGNHDARTDDAAGYFELFSERAGPAPDGWYSYELGDWLVVVLNSNCDDVGGCGPDSRQAEWLERELSGPTTGNVLAYWHHPRFSTGGHGDDQELDTLWQLLADGGVDVALSGHDHDYQRYTPMDRDGVAAERGLRQFVVGTGGKGLRPFERADDRVEFRQDDQLGVLRLDLRACGYGWRFLAVDGSVLDDGEAAGTC